jgi:hypothetical protein
LTSLDGEGASSLSEGKTRRTDSLHLHGEPDGSARVIDDRTFTAAHVNKAARIILEALHEPRTRRELAAILADAADCDVDDAIEPVVRLVDEFTALGWIESSGAKATELS